MVGLHPFISLSIFSLFPSWYFFFFSPNPKYLVRSSLLVRTYPHQGLSHLLFLLKVSDFLLFYLLLWTSIVLRRFVYLFTFKHFFVKTLVTLENIAGSCHSSFCCSFAGHGGRNKRWVTK
jgi:hypothetical protein